MLSAENQDETMTITGDQDTCTRILGQHRVLEERIEELCAQAVNATKVAATGYATQRTPANHRRMRGSGLGRGLASSVEAAVA